LQKQNNLIAGLRATNNTAVPPQDIEKGKEEKGKEVSIDREEETEIKVCLISHFICFITPQAFLVEKCELIFLYHKSMMSNSDIFCLKNF